MNKVNERIKQFRKNLGWTLQETATKFELTVTGYAHIENGKSSISIDRLYQIAGIFGTSISELLGLEESVEAGKQQSKIVEELEKLKEELAEAKGKLTLQSKLLEAKEILMEAKENQLLDVAEKSERSCFLSFFAWYTRYTGGILSPTKITEADTDFWDRLFSLGGMQIIYSNKLVSNSYYEERFQEFLERKKQSRTEIYPFEKPPQPLTYDK